MAGFDGTGPAGLGPFTGRGMGYCIAKLSGLDVPAPLDKYFEDVRNEVFDMPRGDRTGPAGMGPMTGRAAGFCAGYSAPGFMNGAGGGFGRGRGMGMGRRNRFYATGLTGWQRGGVGGAGYAPPSQAVSEQQELDALKNQAEYFADALGQIRKRIEDIEKSSE